MDEEVAGRYGSYRAALMALIPVVPLVMAAILISTYAAQDRTDQRFTILGTPALEFLKQELVLSSAALTVVIWFVAAGFLYWVGFTSPAHASPQSFYALRRGLTRVETTLRVCPTGALTTTEQIAWERADAYARAVQTGLETNSIGWLRGTSYASLWNLLHRAEQDLIYVEPTPLVIEGALYDDSRLEDSRIGDHEDLQQQLRRAVLTLSPEAGAYVISRQAALPAPGTSVMPPSSGTAGGAGAANAPQVTASDRQIARASLAEIRHIIDEFRASRWREIISARNHLLGATALTTLVTTILLVFAFHARVDTTPTDRLRDPILSATAFYLVGAIVGLFKRLYDERGAEFQVGGVTELPIDDYGMYWARLLLTPVLSGLSAVGGVLILAMVAGAFSGDALIPRDPSGGAQAGSPTATTSTAVGTSPVLQATVIPTATPTGVGREEASRSAATQPPLPPTLADIFNLAVNRFGLVIAAVFGFAPGTLVSQLSRQTDRFAQDLRSTQPRT